MTTTIRPHPTDPPQSRPSSVRGPLNAWFFDTFDRYINHVARPHKRAAFDGIESSRILEIGSGTGANLDYLPPGSHLVALEPNTAMHRRLHRRAAERAIDLELLVAPGEIIPLDDDSIDTVICSLVLCTVDNPSAVLAEIIRVLRPGGTFRFVEHVAADSGSPRRWLQRTLRRPWAWIFEGCQLCRHTADTITNAGFTTVTLRRQRFRHSMFVPVNAAIHGIATK
jgi:ubiquinone/menaquinone biosynthesis C-methylase UbiE